MSTRDRLRLLSEEPLHQHNKDNSEPQTEYVPPAHSPAQAILKMQRTHGNQAVRRMLSRIQRSTLEDGGPLNEEISSQINSKRGSGSALDGRVQAEMGQALGRDFSDVSVHTDSQSDQLNKQLGAKAFTTGSDIFFSQGSYQPGTGDGDRLLAHELTHVVHQDGAAPSGNLTLGPADDHYERQADQMADSVTSDATQAQAVQRAEMEEELDPEGLQAMRDPALQRQEEEPIPEEEELEPDTQAMRDPKLQRQELPEEDPV